VEVYMHEFSASKEARRKRGRFLKRLKKTISHERRGQGSEEEEREILEVI